MAKAQKKKRLFTGIIIAVIVLLLAFIAGFFIYVRTHRLFPNMPGLVDVLAGVDHFSTSDHVGLYEHGNNTDITGSGRTEEDRLVLTKKEGGGYDLLMKPVQVDTTSFSTYELFPCKKPVDVSLIFDKDQKLCCTELVYHFKEEELIDFQQEWDNVAYAVDKRERSNILCSVYATLAEKLGYKRYNTMRRGSAEDTQLVVQEFYRTKAYK